MAKHDDAKKAVADIKAAAKELIKKIDAIVWDD